MITLISGTNRPGSNTRKVTDAYSRLLDSIGEEHLFFSLEDLPRDFAFSYLEGRKSADFDKIMSEFILPADKLLLVIPEYNGSFPGIFKLFLDAIHPIDLHGKKVTMTGVATGRSGNLRGIDGLTGAFHYMGMTVYPKNLPISLLRDKLNASGDFNDEATLKAMRIQLEGFIAF